MRHFILIIFLLLIIPSVSALTLETKDVFAPSETLIGRLDGIVTEPIKKEQVELIRDGHISTPLSSFDIRRLQDIYFVYAVMPSNPIEGSNYTLFINDVSTYVDGQLEKIDIEKPIKFEGNETPFSIYPGFLIAREGSDITFISHVDKYLEIPIKIGEDSTLTIKPGETKISLDLSPLSPGLSTIKIGIYDVPVYVEEQVTPFVYGGKIRFFPQSLSTILLKNTEGNFEFILTNVGNERIDSIEVGYNTTYFSITPEKIDLDVNESMSFNLTIKKYSSPLNELIFVKTSNETFQIPIAVDYTENSSEVKIPAQTINPEASQGYYCRELSGQQCSSSEVCSGKTAKSIDVDQCCLASCTVKPKTSSYSWIGYLLGAIVIIILVIVGGRYLKGRSPKGDEMKQRIAKAEKGF